MMESRLAEFGLFGMSIAAAFYSVVWLGAKGVGWLPSLQSSHPPSVPIETVSVVIAARNEAENLSPCLASVLAQKSVRQVIVVDDHSIDGTTEVLASIAAQDARVVVVPNLDLPPGWIGKSLALQTGARLASEPLILFCDADVLFAPGVVGDAANLMAKEQLDHLSGHFFVLCRTPAEHVCSPVLVLSSSLALFGTARWAGAATGAFNMVRAATYWKYRGHELLKDQVVDDVALARHLVRSGARSRFLRLGHGVKVRLFVGLSGFVDAISRSSVSFLTLGSLPACFAALAFLVLNAIALVGLLLPAAGLFLQAQGADVRWALFLFGPIPYAAGLLAVSAAGQFTEAKPAFRFLYPLGAIALGYGVLKAGLCQLCGGQVSWRGRNYSIQ